MVRANRNLDGQAAARPPERTESARRNLRVHREILAACRAGGIEQRAGRRLPRAWDRGLDIPLDARRAASDHARVSVADTLRALRLAREGDPTARESLLARIRPRVVLWCAARMSADMRARIDAEDLAQEILLGVHGRLDEFDGDTAARFYGWVFRIAENRICDTADHFGALRRRPVDRAPRDATSPSEAASRREVVARVRDAVGRLGDDHRDVVRMHLLEGRDVADVARAMGRTPTAVRVLYCRALRALREEVPDLS